MTSHRQDSAVERTMLAAGKLYCPWRESWVARPKMVAPETLTIADWKQCFNLKCTRPDAPILRAWQANFLRDWFGTSGSFALQADPGEGKTRAALLAADHIISSGGCAVIVVQTKDHLQQIDQEIRSLFTAPDGGPVDRILAVLSGRQGPKGRQKIYDDPTKQLIVITAECCARDMGSTPRKGKEELSIPPRLKLTSRDLLVLDEGDLMRGNEGLARIHRKWKSIDQGEQTTGLTANRPRLLIQSATLTISHNPDEEHGEVLDYKKRHGVERFFNVPAPSSLNYDIAQPSVGRLPEGVCIASQSIRNQFWELIEGIEYAELDANNDSESSVQRRIRALNKGRVKEPQYGRLGLDEGVVDTGRHVHVLPSIKTVLGLVSALRANIDEFPEWPRTQVLRNCLRDAYQALTLYHCNSVLTNELRVSFLEYAGQLIHESKVGDRYLPHLRALFPPGALPPWWTQMARGTPYESLPGSSASSFFGNERELGSAARELMDCKIQEHPNLRSTLQWLTGGIRQRSPGQAMLVCGTAMETMYLRDKIEKETGESGVSLMGHSHLAPSRRSENFGKAHSGVASLVTATSVAERGVDLQSLKNLLILNPPYDLRQAKQLLGRVGRNPEIPGLVSFMYAEGSSREIMLRALVAKSARYGDDSPLKQLFFERLPRRRRRGPVGPGLFE